MGPEASGSDFPNNAWAGTPPTTLEALLPLLQPSTAPSLQSLSLRMLAGSASWPVEAAQPQQPGSGDVLTGIRIETLTTFGRNHAALALIRTVPPPPQMADAAQVATDLAFLDGDLQGACNGITGPYANFADTFWLEARLTCQILSGQNDAATQALNALSGNTEIAPFLALATRALGGQANMPDNLPAPQPLSLALVAKAGNGFPYRGLDGASLSLLRAVALTSGIYDDARLLAAEKAAAYGALPASTLAAAYLALPVAPADKASPIDAASRHRDARGRAILFQAAHDATDPSTRANLLAGFLAQAAQAGLYQVSAAAAADLLVSIPVAPSLKPDAIDFARALYVLDRPDAARPWLDLASQSPLTAVQTRAVQSITVLAHIVGGPKAPDWTGFSLLPDGTNGNANTATVTKAALAAELLVALGEPAPDTALLSLLADNTAAGTSWPMPAAGPPLLLANAAAANRLGGTVLALLASLGGAGAGASPPQEAQAVAALRAVGLDEDARHLAIDAAVAAGY
ncbi:MAG TPA: hypothetical protein VL574_16335 [Stellaceae bacterium]|nr:hypothetical protein [Stellaceae bacterium]